MKRAIPNKILNKRIEEAGKILTSYESKIEKQRRTPQLISYEELKKSLRGDPNELF